MAEVHRRPTSEPLPASPSAPSPEDQARAHIKEFTDWWTKVWNSGLPGKVGIVLVLVAFVLPFFFDVAAAFLAWFFVWPYAVNVTEKLAVLGFIFVVFTAIGVQVRNAANQIVTGFFLARRRRTRRGREAPPNPPT